MGSTTVVMSLMDLNTGNILAEEGCFNKQIAYGEDILTRIFHTQSGEAARAQLQKATADTFSELLDRLERASGVRASRCPVMVIGGNTTMIHFLLASTPSASLCLPSPLWSTAPASFSEGSFLFPLTGLYTASPPRPITWAAIL